MRDQRDQHKIFQESTAGSTSFNENFLIIIKALLNFITVLLILGFGYIIYNLILACYHVSIVPRYPLHNGTIIDIDIYKFYQLNLYLIEKILPLFLIFIPLGCFWFFIVHGRYQRAITDWNSTNIILYIGSIFIVIIPHLVYHLDKAFILEAPLVEQINLMVIYLYLGFAGAVWCISGLLFCIIHTPFFGKPKTSKYFSYKLSLIVWIGWFLLLLVFLWVGTYVEPYYWNFLWPSSPSLYF